MGHRFVDYRVIQSRMNEKDARIQREQARRTAVHEPLVRSCKNCEAYNGDGFCTLPDREQLFSGHIKQAELVVCARHEARGR